MVALFPPLDSMARGLKLSFTFTPVHVTAHTAAPEKLGPLADADPTPTIVTKETGRITAQAPNKILLLMLMISPLCVGQSTKRPSYAACWPCQFLSRRSPSCLC